MGVSERCLRFQGECVQLGSRPCAIPSFGPKLNTEVVFNATHPLPEIFEKVLGELEL